jgi:hypothetical protein
MVKVMAGLLFELVECELFKVLRQGPEINVGLFSGEI